MTDYSLAKRSVVGVSVIAAAFLAGCVTSSNDDGDDRFALANSQAAFGQQDTDWNTPFWNRFVDKARADAEPSGAAQAESTTPTGNAAAAPGAAVTSTQTATTVPAVAATAQPQTGAGRGLRPQVGVYIDGDRRNSLVAYQFVNALAHRAAANGVSVVKPDSLVDAIAASNACDSSVPKDCIQALAIFPGIRALLVVRPEPASSDSSRMTVQTRMLDADFGVEYQPIETTLNVSRQDGKANTDLAIWSDRMLGLVRDRIAIAPWFTHSFALDGKDMYVSAGLDSGLTVGSVLTVRDDGTVVRAPGGRVVAWKPRPPVGEVRIKQLIGSHLAVAEQVSGQMPQPRDKLIAR